MRKLIDGMSFRRRLALAGTGVVAIAILLALGTAFFVMRSELRGQVDDSLRQVAGHRGADVLFTQKVVGPEVGPAQIPEGGVAAGVISQRLA
jgi:hypothetical protein